MDRARVTGDAAQQSQIDRLLAPYRGDGVPGIALAVIRNGEAALVRTHGCADLGSAIPVLPETNFRLASLTKQFTAACIMMLAERGCLDLDARLPELFGDFPAFGREIRLRDLLQHSSGLIDYESVIGPNFAGQLSDRDVFRIVRESGRTDFEPGSKFRYSNTGYALLAVLVEEASGTGFARFLSDNIFAPLTMGGTVAFELGKSNVEKRALGYTVAADGRAVLSDQDATSAVLGDGGVYSSLVDYMKWDDALYTDALLPSTLLEAMWVPGIGHYGYGWRIDTFEGRRRLHHEGFSCGFQNHVMRFPEERLTVLVLSNRRDPAVQPIAEAVSSLYLT